MKKVFLIALIALVFMAGAYAEEKTTKVTWDLSTDGTDRQWGFYEDVNLTTPETSVVLDTIIEGATVKGTGETYVGYKIIGPAVTIKLYANSGLTIDGSGNPIDWTGTLSGDNVGTLDETVIGGANNYESANAITILDESESGTPPATALRTDHYLLTVETVDAAKATPGNYSAVMTLVLEPVDTI